MSGNFNGQILAEKLAKLNNSQQSIETLSHWCIFHRKKAKQVVETWEKQFQCSPREQRVSYLYLANDILQNSRRKGSEFVVEFWKVLPNALKDLLENGDEFGRNAALRLVGIWEERKVFGSRGQVLKEELLGRSQENHSRNGNDSSSKLKQKSDDMLEKLISSYEHVSESSMDEDFVLNKCHAACICIDKAENEIKGASSTGVSEAVQDLHGQRDTVRECVEKLKAVELSRSVLVLHLREVLHEQELKLEHIRNQLKTAQAHSELAGDICEQLIKNNAQSTPDQSAVQVASFSSMQPSFTIGTQNISGEKEKIAPVMYTEHAPFRDNHSQTDEEQRKNAAAEVAAKLTASTSSAQIFEYVLSSLASESVLRQQISGDYISDNKRAKLENGLPYIPQHLPQIRPQSSPQLDSLQQMVSAQPPLQQPSPSLSSMPQSVTNVQSLQLSLPPLQPPLAPNQFMQAAGSMTSVPFSYGVTMPQRPHPLHGYQLGSAVPYQVPNSYQNVHLSEVGTFSGQQSLSAAPPSVSQQ